MLMIRLSRTGARKQPQYRVVVIEKERARNGRPVEVVGTYNPRTSPASIELKRERIDYWVSKGAKMSDRVSKIVSKPAPAPPLRLPDLPVRHGKFHRHNRILPWLCRAGMSQSF